MIGASESGQEEIQKARSTHYTPFSMPHFFSQFLTSGTEELGAESQSLKFLVQISSAISASVI